MTIKKLKTLAEKFVELSPQKLDKFEGIEFIHKPIFELISQAKIGILSDPELAWMGLWEIGAIYEKKDIAIFKTNDNKNCKLL